MTIALTRPVPASLAHCELTHLERVPIDLARAADEHRGYEDALRALGCAVRHVPAADDLPDSVFVEDVAIALEELAIITRAGGRRAGAQGVRRSRPCCRRTGRFARSPPPARSTAATCCGSAGRSTSDC